MKEPQNPFTEAVLRLTYETFCELLVATRAGTVDTNLINTAEKAIKSYRQALEDLGVEP